MLRRLTAATLVAAASLAIVPAAHAVKDCDGQQVCFCGQEIAIGLPGKDPIIVLGRIDC
jgi:hypothetical protein